MSRQPALDPNAYGVTCGRPECAWGVRRPYQREAWDALYAHLLKAHGHDVHAEKERTTR